MFSGCETDIDIIAPKRDMTIIYGLLEANKDRQFIRINKAFVGEESATVLAGISGVNEYTENELSARIVEINPSGAETGKVWQLKSMYLYTKDTGIFASDSNKVYYFDTPLEGSGVNPLNPEKYYQLICVVDIDGEDVKTVTATTAVLGNTASSGGLAAITLLKPNLVGASSDPTQADRAEVDFLGAGDYRTSQEVTWSKAKGGVAYNSYYRFYYKDVDTISGAVRKDSMIFTVGSRRVDNPDNPGSVSFVMSPKEFFITIDRDVPDYDFGNESFKRIASDTLQYFLEVADNNLATYMEVNQPKTEIIQEQPEYTNVENGIGLFASRYITSTRTSKQDAFKSGRVFKGQTLEELLYSNQVVSSGDDDEKYYTVNKGFTRPGRCNDALQTCK